MRFSKILKNEHFSILSKHCKNSFPTIGKLINRKYCLSNAKTKQYLLQCRLVSWRCQYFRCFTTFNQRKSGLLNEDEQLLGKLKEISFSVVQRSGSRDIVQVLFSEKSNFILIFSPP